MSKMTPSKTAPPGRCDDIGDDTVVDSDTIEGDTLKGDTLEVDTIKGDTIEGNNIVKKKSWVLYHYYCIVLLNEASTLFGLSISR